MPVRAVSTPSRRETPELRALTGPFFDLLVIGGGISGASVLRDASLRGLRAALVERGDYASGTTQATSKLIHGGLRYLKNGELGLVRESLRERRTLARIAPHALRPEAFLFPMYRNGRGQRGPGRLALGAALTIYDLLGADRNRGVGAEHCLPAARFLDTTTTLAEEPGLDFRHLRGSYIYYDYANLNPERLCVEFILAAREAGAVARNYTEVRRIARQSDESYHVQVVDHRTGRSGVIRARAVINAGGPWADALQCLATGKIDKHLVRSKGIHLVTRRFVREKTVVLMRADGTHLFVIPWRGRSLIGTTDTRFDGQPDQMRVTAGDARAVLEDVNRLFPEANLDMDDIDYFYGGLRPLVDESGQSSYNTSRRVEILHHRGDAAPEGGKYAGLFTVLGGKYTTSRRLAERVVDQVCDYLPGKFAPCRTHLTPLPGGEMSSLTELVEHLERRFPDAPHRKIHILAGRYGAVAARILKRAPAGRRDSGRRSRPAESGGEYRLTNGEVYYPEEIDYLIVNEDIETASDLFFRRSGIGTTGRAPETVVRRIVQQLGARLGWNRGVQKLAMAEIDGRYVLATET
jgi:glycerol-3-phosphate dehydrogenase